MSVMAILRQLRTVPSSERPGNRSDSAIITQKRRFWVTSELPTIRSERLISSHSAASGPRDAEGFPDHFRTANYSPRGFPLFIAGLLAALWAFNFRLNANWSGTYRAQVPRRYNQFHR